MKTYSVLWEIEVDADNPRAAAIEAQHVMKMYPDAQWTFFVREQGMSTTTRIDLEENE